MASRSVAWFLDLVGVKGKDGATISSVANPVPVEVESSALPSGAATLAEQQTHTTHLATIDNYRYAGGKTAYVGTIIAAGNTSVVTPASGNRIRVFWVAFIPSSDNAAANLFKLGFGTTSGSISTELYRAYAMAHWEVFTGTANQSVIVNAATAEAVSVTIHYQEIP